MVPQVDRDYIAFAGKRRIATGDLRKVLAKVKDYLKSDQQAGILIFDAQTSHQVEVDLRGTKKAVLSRLEMMKVPEPQNKVSGPGRPKLGVVAREVTLLPRHWEWLSEQPGGASVTLRKLVEAAQKRSQGRDTIRHAQESLYRFMTTMAGDFPNYEEALRAFYAKKETELTRLIQAWPADIRKHVQTLAKVAFEI